MTVDRQVEVLEEEAALLAARIHEAVADVDHREGPRQIWKGILLRGAATRVNEAMETLSKAKWVA